MRIAFDLRSLSGGKISGVENYSLNLLQHLPQQDKKNFYVLFYNSFRNNLQLDTHYINSETKATRFPSKLLNLALKLNLLKVEQMTGPIDWLFMPNLNQYSIQPKTKLAITVHDLSPVVTPEFYNIKRRLWHNFLNYKDAFNRASVLFAVSEYTKNDLIKIFKVPEQKIKVIYPGLDHENFKPNINEAKLRAARNFYGLPGKYILFLNTIEPRKNLSAVIKAFEGVTDDCDLVIAGRLGWKFKQDFKLISQSKKSAKIKYIGYISEQHKPAIIKMAKVLVYPSFYEGFGFQCLEALALGTPVLTSAVSASPEVVGDAGMLINPYDVNSIRSGLNNLLHNNNLREILIEKGFAKALKFQWGQTAQKISESLNTL